MGLARTSKVCVGSRRWGYNSTEALEEVSNNYSAAGIPLEVRSISCVRAGTLATGLDGMRAGAGAPKSVLRCRFFTSWPSRCSQPGNRARKV